MLSIGKHPVNELTINDQLITSVKCLKYLAIVIDEKLLWNHHVKYLTCKVDRRIMRILNACWLNRKVEIEMKIKLCHQVLMPMLTYEYEIWYDEIREKKT